MRHPVAMKLAAASRNDREPAFRIFLEQRTLERIDLVADENGNGQWNLRFLLSSLRALSISSHTHDTRLIDVDASVIIEG
jgi:hypothetical protein